MLEDVYFLSPLQEGLYYHWLSAPASQAYVEQTCYQVKGHFNIAILEKSYQELVTRHAILRTFFTQEIGDRPLQIVKKTVDSAFSYLDFSGNIADFKAADRAKGFDLHAGSQMRLTVLGLGEDTYEFIWSFHHILMDGWCCSILINDFFRFYIAMINGKMPVLPRVYPYSSYISWLSKIDKEKTIAYWQDHLTGYDAVNTLQKTVANENKEYIKQERRIVFKGAVRQSIASLCIAAGVTESTFIQTAWGILLGRYNNTSDVVFGSIVSGRPAELEGIENMIGLFINTIPVRVQYNPETTGRELLKAVHQAAVEGMPHHYVQLAEIQSGIASGSNLFDHILSFENFPVQERVEKSVTQEENKTKTTLLSASFFELSNYDFAINASAGETITIKFTYNVNAFEEIRINEMQQQLARLIENLVQAPDSLVHEIDYLSLEEKLQLQTALNNTAVDYPRNKTIVSLFEEQVEKTPDNIALVFENTRLTYRELNEKANQLAAYLRQQYDIRPDDLAGIKLERSEWMVITILGVIKSGGAYMPVDPQYPQERIDFMLADSRCKVLIDDRELHVFMEVAECYDRTNPALINKPADLAYVIYTSGTTGKPKGTLIEHRNVVRLFKNEKSLFDFRSDDTWTMFHSFCFDLSVWEMYGALLFGGKLIVIPALTAIDPVAYLEVLSREKVTILNQTPSSFYNLIKQDVSLQLRYVNFGGEALSPRKLKEWNARYPDTKILNLYGPTETTMCVTYKEITTSDIESNISNIGKPLPTVSLYVLDQQQHLVPVGTPGELYIGGEGVARGYLNRPELTSQRFIPNPFTGGTLYRSGDSVRILPNGELEYIGRIDDQVKIKGYRIELGEIENVLLNTDKIEAAVVCTQKNDKNENYLVAYVVSKEPLNTLELRQALSDKLPSYMLPENFVQLETLPLTSNGKVDKKRLSAMAGLELNTGITYVAPGNEIEQQLVAVFEEVLKKEQVGIKDDFFILGGDSIKSIQIVSRLKQRGYTLTIQDVMLYPVISELAEHVNLVNRTADQGLAEGFIPMTPIQAAFFQSEMINKHHLNQSVLLYSKEQISSAGLTAALDKLILHHDALRMVYRKSNSGWIQENKGADQGYSFEVIEEADNTRFIADCERIQSTFDLTTGPLFKAALFRGGSGDRLLLVAHHLVVDAVSWRIIFEDLSDLYQQYLTGQPLHLPLKTDSFQYWQEKQAAYALSETLEEEDKYWSAIESVVIDTLPVDYPEGSNLMKDAASCMLSLDEDTTRRLLTECYKTHQTEINDILLTGLSLALNDVFHLKNVLIKLEGHGREDIGTDIDITRTVGWFTTTHPVVFDMSQKDDVIRQLIAIKENLHSVPNKGIGYGILRYLGGKPYVLDPQISFNYLGDFGSGVETTQGDKIFEFSGEYHGKGCPDDMPREAVLEVNGMVVNNKMGISIRYSSQQYDAVTIETLKTAYQQRMETLIMLLSVGEKVEKTANMLPASYNQLFYVAPWEVKSRVVVSTYEYEHLDIPAFNAAIQQLITRHEILRTVFIKADGILQQQILSAETLKFEPIACIPLKSENEWQEITDEALFSKFNLDTFPLIRVNIYKPEQGKYQVLFTLHHIITDGYSKGLLQKEFMQLYNENLQGSTSVLQQPGFHYRDFTSWQRNFLYSQQGEKLKRYWLTKLDGFKLVLEFPSSLKHITEDDLSIRSTSVLHGVLYEKLNEYAQKNNLTRSAVLMGALTLLLNKMTGEDDITVGTAVSGRNSRHFGELDISRSIGYFANVLLVRNRIDHEMQVTDYLQNVQQCFLEDLNYGDYPFTKLVEELPGLNISRRFLDDIVFYNYHNYDHYKNAVYQISEAVEDTVPTQCNFGLTVTEFKNCFRLELMFNPHLFDAAQRNEIQEHYFSILEQIVYIPELMTATITADMDGCQKGCRTCKACSQRKVQEEVSNHFIL